MRVVILHTVRQAKTELRHHAGASDLLFVTTHNKALIYLHSQNIANAHDIDQFSKDAQSRSFFEASDKQGDACLDIMDSCLASMICSAARTTEFPVFKTLYRHILKNTYYVHAKILYALEVIVAKHDVKEMAMYPTGFTRAYGDAQGIIQTIEGLCDKHGITFTRLSESNSQLVRIHDKLIQFKQDLTLKTNWAYHKRQYLYPTPQKIKQAILKRIRPPKNTEEIPVEGKPVVITFPSHSQKLFNQLIEETLDDVTIVTCPFTEFPTQMMRTGNVIKEEVDTVIKTIEEFDVEAFGCDDPLMQRLAWGQLHNFKAEAMQLIQTMSSIEKTLSAYSIAAIVWQLSPSWGFLALLVRMAQEKGIPIIGLQHGGVYGYQDASFKHFDSDFDRCDHYFSYGYDAHDLARAYPNRPIKSHIHPTGSLHHSTLLRDMRPSKEAIDVLFAPTRTFNAFAWNSNCHIVFERQMAVIENLDGHDDLKVFIKPAPDNANNSIFTDMKKQLRNASVCQLGLYEFLEFYDTKLVVLDTASTPLLDVMHLDVDIIVFRDLIYPFFPESEALLTQRAFIVDSIEEFQSHFRQWKQGKLPRLRSMEFYTKYVSTKHTKRNTLNALSTFFAEADTMVTKRH